MRKSLGSNIVPVQVRSAALAGSTHRQICVSVKLRRRFFIHAALCIHNQTKRLRRISLKATPHKACAEDAPTDFFVRLYRNSAGILSYVKGFLCKMTENMSADSVQSRQAGFVRCCLKAKCGVIYYLLSFSRSSLNSTDRFRYSRYASSRHIALPLSSESFATGRPFTY